MVLMLRRFNVRYAALRVSEGLSRLGYAFDNFSDMSRHASAVPTSQRQENVVDFPSQH